MSSRSENDSEIAFPGVQESLKAMSVKAWMVIHAMSYQMPDENSYMHVDSAVYSFESDFKKNILSVYIYIHTYTILPKVFAHPFK